MKYILVYLLALVTADVLADNYYLDIGYEGGNLLFPKKKSKLMKFFTDDENSLLVTATVIKRGNGKDTILVPPTLLEKYDIIDDKLTRIATEDISLVMSYFKKPNEQVIMKVDFYSVNKSSASAFSKGLVDMAAAYSGGAISSHVSEIAQAAIELMSTVLLDNKDVNLSYIGGIDLDNKKYEKKLYFDDNGVINEAPLGDEKTAATIIFEINGYKERKIHFDLGFEEQADDGEKLLFANFNSIRNLKSGEKKLACYALYDYLKRKNTISSANDLLAIAINDSRWPQDETDNWCIKPEAAINYRIQHGLEFIANCVSNNCLQTKKIILVSKGVTDFSELKPFTGGVDITSKGCFDSTKFTTVYSWNGFKPVSYGSNFDAYKFNTCLKAKDGSNNYEHIISWYEGKLFSHSCEVIPDPNGKCT